MSARGLYILAAALGLAACGGREPEPQPEPKRAAPPGPPPQPEFRIEAPAPPPDVLVIALNREHAAHLLHELYLRRPDARNRPYEIMETSPEAAQRIAAELRRVPKRKIKFVAIDGELWDSNDPWVSPEMKKLTATDVFTLGIEFVD